jgi:hypothetical protein
MRRFNRDQQKSHGSTGNLDSIKTGLNFVLQVSIGSMDFNWSKIKTRDSQQIERWQFKTS